MLIRTFTWLAFVACMVFAYFATALPGHYYLASSAEAHHGDYAIGWFWMTAFGFLPAVLLLGLVFLQRRETPKWLLVLWATPAVLVLVSAAVLIYQANVS